MNDQLAVVKTILAALVIEKVLTKKKAQSALNRIEKQYIRGVMLPVEFGTLIDILAEDM